MANAQIDRDLAARLGRPGAWSFEVPSLELDWSDEARAILGVEQDDPFSFENARALVHPDWRALCAHAFFECIKHGTSFDIEFQGYTARGALVWVRLVGEASRDSHGRTYRVSGAVQDITERKNAAERFLELSQRMKHTYESVTDSFFTLDRQWRFTYVNGAAERMLKRPREELLGQVAWTVFPGTREGPFHSQYERAMAQGTTVEFEAYSDILRGWVKVVAYPSVQGLAVYSKDITESRRVRQELVDSEERYRLLFETSVDAIFQQTSDGRILRANPAACAMLDMSEAELCQLHAGAIIAPEEQRALALRNMRRITGKAVGELRIMRKDGTRIAVEVSTAEHCTEDGRTVVNTILRDVSKRVLQERDIRHRNADLTSRVQQRTAELEAANAELRSFAHSLAHDLRSPIATIQGFSTMLAESMALSGVNAGQHYVSASARRQGR
jgi:PAS domain S-box-containing protein